MRPDPAPVIRAAHRDDVPAIVAMLADSAGEVVGTLQLTLHSRAVPAGDASRIDAHRFYLRLGFRPSHVGMKLAL